MAVATRELKVSVVVDGVSSTYKLRATDEQIRKIKGSGEDTGEALKDAFDKSAQSADDLAEAADGAGSRFQGLSGEARELGQALREGDYEGAAASLGRLRAQAGAAGLAIGGTVAVVTAGAVAYGAAAYQAASFEEALTAVGKTTGLAGADLDALGEGIQDLAGQLGLGQRELAAIAETAGQLGISGRDNLLAFTETVAKLSAVSELSAEQASEQIARIANAFDLPISQAEQLGSVLNELSNTTTAKAGDISRALTRVGSSGASIGLTVDEVAALGATLIDTGIESETAGTSMRNVFIRLQSEAEKLAEVAGMTEEEFSALVQEDALAALRAYLEGLQEMPKSLRAVKIKEVFGDENFLAVQSLAEQTDLLNRNLATSGEAVQEGTSLNTEFARTLETVSKQWAKLKGNLLDVATTVGGTALPALQGLLETINGMFSPVSALRDEFGRLRGEFQKVTQKQQLLDRYNELVASGREGTDEFKRVVSQLASELPDYAVKWNQAGEAVGVYADQVQTLISMQRQQVRLEMMDNLQEQAGQFQEKLTQLRGAQDAYMESLGEMEQQVNIGTLRDIQKYLSAGVSPDNIVFAGYRDLVKDLKESKSTIDETKPAVEELARSFSVWYDITSTPGTEAYRQDLAMLSQELGITEEAAATLIDQMQLLSEEADQEASGESGGGLRKTLGDLGDASEETKSALALAREELEKFETKLEDYEGADLKRLAALQQQTDEVKKQLEYYEQMVEAMANVPDQVKPWETPTEEDLQQQTPDRIEPPEMPPVPDLGEEWNAEVQFALQGTEDFGSETVQMLNEVSAKTEYVAGGIAQNMMAAFEAAGGATEEFFQLYKAFAIAEAIASTYLAANKALASAPPPFNYALAASVVAAGLANVAKIATASPSDSIAGSNSSGKDQRRSEPPAFADGVTNYEGGVALVGEEGPELVSLPGGSNVITNENTRALLGAIGRTAPRIVQAGGLGGRGTEAIINRLDRVERAFTEKQFRLRGTEMETQNARTEALYNDAGIK